MPLHDTMLAQFADMLRTAIGLDTDIIGMQAIARAVYSRQAVRGMNDLHAYWDCVQRSDKERQELIEEVIVPETWFFREEAALAAMANMALWLLRNGARRMIRALSLPCATGEEPYSMAMALLDAGVQSERFHIDGIDISARALARARDAVYENNAFRSKDVRFRERYFTQTERGYSLRNDVAATVTFRHGNIFDVATLPHSRKYDFIFLRNVLIYFGPAQRTQAISTVLQLLQEEGCLFVGSAETGLLRAHGLVRVDMPKACGFQRATESAAAQPRVRTTKRAARSALPHAAAKDAAAKTPSKGMVPRLRQPVPGSPTTRAPPVEADKPAGADSLAQAAELADRGQLDQANALCEQYLASRGPSAQVLNLLGLIHDARGHGQQAVDFYRKVLYLDPNHVEALAHLAALLDKQGHGAEATRLRQRYERITTRNEK